MKNVVYYLINHINLIQRIYLHLFNKIISGSIDYPGFFFRNNRIDVSKGNSLEFGNNLEIYNLYLNCKGENNKLSFGNKLHINGSQHMRINIIGNNNVIKIDDNCNLQDVSFFIRGNNNIIHIKENCSAVYTEFHIEQNTNEIKICKGTTMHGREGRTIHIALDEATKLCIDEDCMISNNVQFRTTDSHSIISMDGHRINPAKDIYIGKHCWIGLNALILKGVNISDHNVIAAGALCTKSFNESNTIIGGNPAVVIKREVDWDRKFL